MMEPLVVLAHAPPGGHKPFWHARSTWTWPRVLAGHRMDRLPLVACFAAHRGKACIHAGIFVGAALICSAARVVSNVMRGMARRAGLAYRGTVLSPGVRARVTVEAGTLRRLRRLSDPGPPLRHHRRRGPGALDSVHDALHDTLSLQCGSRLPCGGRCPRSALASPAGAGPPPKRPASSARSPSVPKVTPRRCHS
jgi:hypothetical protein